MEPSFLPEVLAKAIRDADALSRPDKSIDMLNLFIHVKKPGLLPPINAYDPFIYVAPSQESRTRAANQLPVVAKRFKHGVSNMAGMGHDRGKGAPILQTVKQLMGMWAFMFPPLPPGELPKDNRLQHEALRHQLELRLVVRFSHAYITTHE